MNDEQFFLANAYLDGELTDEERGVAEADPAIMAEVEELRALQASLRSVEPPTHDARESALSAAMAEFGRGATPAAVPAPVVPLTPRPAYSKYLAIAAAAVGVGLFATVVVVGQRGSDDDDSAAEPVAEQMGDEPADEPASEPAFTESFESDGDDDMSAVADGAGAEESGEEMAGEVSEEAEAAADMAAESDVMEESASDEPADEPAGDVDSEPPAATIAPAARVSIAIGDPITGPVELGSYGAELLDLQAAGELGSTPNTSCLPELNILNETTLIEDDIAVPVYVGVREGFVFAIDKETCLPRLDAAVIP